MRSITVDLCDKSIRLPVSYSAGSQLSAAGHDPFAVFGRVFGSVLSNSKDDLESALSAAFQNMRAQDAIEILHAGAVAAGADLTIEQVGDYVYAQGVAKYVGAAGRYILAFNTATTEHPVPGEGEAA